jgi:hypothetical protein
MLWGPQLFGKRTMLRYLLERLREDSVSTGVDTLFVELDLRLLAPNKNTTGELLLAHIVDSITRALRVSGTMEATGRLLWTVRLTRWLGESILPRVRQLVLVIEGASALHGLTVGNEFYNMLKHWAEQGHRVPWSNLRLIMLSSITPALLIAGEKHSRSPWSMPPIEVSDFTVEQAQKLARAYDLDWTRDMIETELMPHVGGHPYLLSIAMYDARLNDRPFEQVMDDVRAAGGPFQPYLANLHHRLSSDDDCLSALKSLLQGGRVDVRWDAVEKLSAAGVIGTARRGGYRIRYKLYQTYMRER